MDKLSIEEKVKAYDNRLEKARKWYDTNTNEGYRGILEDIFPEFKESEDERIRKELLTFFRESMHGGHILTNKEYDSWIAWLEKQGEKEHVIAPKFNIGDTIRNKITNEVFTITDRCISLEYYHDINHSHEVKFSEQDNWELVVPKSQRMVSGEAKEAMYDKPAWSEEDEKILNQIIKDYERGNESWLKGQGSLPFGNRIIWLKSLKDRVQPQPKQEWSDIT